tara:strand:+ start:200 stop:580 length:381 start_codon:yes stop_codon:yes gene_type:complete
VKKFLSISELSGLLNLIDKKSKKPQNHVLRYWEKEFSQLRPKIINKRRYYSDKQVETAKLIKFLIKDKGLTIRGTRNFLKNNINKLDDDNSDSLKTTYLKKKLKDKTKTILERINRIKQHGKKNTY